MKNNSNMSTVDFADGRQVCLSYGVPVAVFVPVGTHATIRGYVKTSTRYSVTTSKHANAFAGKDAPSVSPDVFAVLVSPLRIK